jgi:peptide/nickel transport system permease protein
MSSVSPTLVDAARGISTLHRVLRSPSGLLGTLICGMVLIAGMAAPLLAPYDPLAQDLTAQGVLHAPSAAHLLGTDSLGRDILSRILFGARTSLAIAISAVGLSVALGVLLGSTAASFGGWREPIIMRFADSLLAFPLMVLAIAISVALGRGAIGSIIAIAATGTPTFTRLARGQTLRINAHQFMTAAIIMGGGFFWRLWRHVLPNMINPIIVQSAVALSFAVLTESGLSFLGLGVQPPTPSWGLMIAEARNYMALAPHVLFFPAAAIFITVLGINLVGDSLSSALHERRAEG